MDRAACRPDPSWSNEQRYEHTRLFFPERGDSTKAGKKFCARCPVRTQCQSHSEAIDATTGIWGGEMRTRPQPEEKEKFVIPRSLSATSIQVYLACPARWKAEYMDRARMPSGSAASIGSVCHGCTEAWVRDDHHTKPYTLDQKRQVMRAIYDEMYWRYFGDGERYEDGLDMILRWVERTDFSGREILAFERKMSFDIPTSAGAITFNFIMDRFDKLDNGDFEIIDYKSFARPLQPQELKQKPQCRVYALGVQMLYPEIEQVWMTFDLFRYEPIGIVFTRDENRATYRWLCNLAERIVQDDTAEEILNDDCRYCVRKAECKTLQAHTQAGGPLGITDIDQAVRKSFEIDRAIKALNIQRSELEDLILRHMEGSELVEDTIGGLKVQVTMSARRGVDDDRVRSVIGDELMGRYGTMTMAKFDAMMKDPAIEAEKKQALKRLVSKKFGDPIIKIDMPDIEVA